MQCETCHGPGAAHVKLHAKTSAKALAVLSRPDHGSGKFGVDAVPASAPTSAPTQGRVGIKKGPQTAADRDERADTSFEREKILIPRNKGKCLRCHKRLKARPAGFPQIDPREHYALVGVTKDDTPCAECHSPHEPMFVDTHINSARLHPRVDACVNCHKHKQDEERERPIGHPLVFRCDFCHKKVAKSLADTPHKKFDCRICHQSYPISDRGQRVLKHASPRFCLLCHAKQPFRKRKDAPPSIVWPNHREEMGDGEEDAKKVCVDCHREQLHKRLSELEREACPKNEVCPSAEKGESK